jgi:phosphoribosylformylglycinamidine synthase
MIVRFDLERNGEAVTDRDDAGVRNARGNVAGLMPHPERAADAILGSDDGLPILRSLVEAASRAEQGDRAIPVGVGSR